MIKTGTDGLEDENHDIGENWNNYEIGESVNPNHSDGRDADDDGQKILHINIVSVFL